MDMHFTITMAFLCGSPQTAVMLAVVVVFVFQLLIVYNLTCCLLSACTLAGYSFALSMTSSIFSRSSSVILQRTFTLYCVTKVYELLDTVFMVVRHKARQITFLHVFHHSSMLVLSDYARLHAPWPSIAPVLALNSMVHVLLYFYYFLAARHPLNPPRWKRRVTEFQIFQFMLDLAYGTYGYMYHGFCIYGIVYGLTMTSLFMSFYYQSYLRSHGSFDDFGRGYEGLRSGKKYH